MMHDPLTEAFRWPAPFKKGDTHFSNYRSPLFVIWHRDPERDGSDDSCGWVWPKVPREHMDTLHGNDFEGLCSWDELDQRIIGYRLALRHKRRAWQHPRFHVHHWRIQIPAFQRLIRAFERCSKCHERFGLNPGVVCSAWGGSDCWHLRHETGAPA